MSDSQSQPLAFCPRCGLASDGHAWCRRCGLNLRDRSSAGAGTGTHGQPAAAGAPPSRFAAATPLARAWERVTSRADPTVVVAVAVAVVLIAALAIAALASKGHSKPPPLFSPNSYETGTPAGETAESTPTETSTTSSVQAPQVEQVLGEYTQDYSNEDAEALKGLFAETLERHDGNKAPEDLSAAIATYERQFSELQNPRYTLSEEKVEPGSGEASATGRYSISSQNGTVTGSIEFHLVEQEERLLIDKLTIEPSK